MFKHSIFGVFLFVSHSLYALTTLNVTLSTDNNPGGIGEIGDLRYCLNSMNQSLNTTFDDYAITFANPMTIQLNGILPIINNSPNPVNITIGNPGSIATVTIDGTNTYSGFFIPIGNVTIQNMIFQNLIARGGNGGDGISGGGGGMGAGAGIYAPQYFLNGSNPSITLMNVSISNSSAVGGNGGNYLGNSATGNEGGGGGGGFSGNGGSITTTGMTGGAGGGGFGGNGGDVTLSYDSSNGGGGGGGGGLGSGATVGTLTNLGNGGSDQSAGEDGNGYGLTINAGAGAGGKSGGINAGGGGGGGFITISSLFGGGGGGSLGSDGSQAQGSIPPLIMITTLPSGGNGGDGAGGGGGGVVTTAPTNEIDGQSGNGGYGGGGGGSAGSGAYDTSYTVQGGMGGVGGGGGGGGVNLSGSTASNGGDSLGGGGGGGAGPSNGPTASGGIDSGSLGGGAGGAGASSVGTSFGGGGGGGGSGLGAAIFVDTNLNFILKALSGIPTTFNTPNNTTQAGIHGTGGPGASDGSDGSALGNSIFLRSGASLTLIANDSNDILTLGSAVDFTDDTNFGGSGTSIDVRGNGSVIYNGTTNYQGSIRINNANFKVNGLIDLTPIFVCRNSSFSSQRGTLSGNGILTGNVLANSGTISPDIGQTLTLGGLSLNSASSGSLGSLVHIEINSAGTSLVSVTGATSLAGTLEINLDSSAQPGSYTLLTSSGITGTFDTITFTGTTPNYTVSYLPVGAPTYVQFNFLGYPSSVDIPATANGSSIFSPAVVCCGRPIILGPLPVPGSGPTVYTVINQTGNVQCYIRQTPYQTYMKMYGTNGSCTIIGSKDGIVSNPLQVTVP